MQTPEKVNARIDGNYYLNHESNGIPTSSRFAVHKYGIISETKQLRYPTHLKKQRIRQNIELYVFILTEFPKTVCK